MHILSEHGLCYKDNHYDQSMTSCDGTYCRSVHIVVGDNMYRPSLHIDPSFPPA